MSPRTSFNETLPKISNVSVRLTASPLWTVPGTAANEDRPCTSHGPPIGWSQNSSVTQARGDTKWRPLPPDHAVFRDNSGARNRSRDCQGRVASGSRKRVVVATFNIGLGKYLGLQNWLEEIIFSEIHRDDIAIEDDIRSWFTTAVSLTKGILQSLVTSYPLVLWENALSKRCLFCSV